MNIDDRLNQLKQINPVDAPPFLLTRIRQRIQNLGDMEAPLQWKWAFAFTTLIILALNISILFTSAGNETAGTTTSNKAEIQNVFNSLDLSTSNNLYNE